MSIYMLCICNTVGGDLFSLDPACVCMSCFFFHLAPSIGGVDEVVLRCWMLCWVCCHQRDATKTKNTVRTCVNELAVVILPGGEQCR